MMSDTIWRMLTGKNGEYEDKFLSTGKIYMTIDKSNFDLRNGNRDEIKRKLKKNRPQLDKSRLGKYAGCLYRFASEMQKGHKIILSLKKSKLSKTNIGIIVGDYEYDPAEDEPYWHSREVLWVKEDYRLPKNSLSGSRNVLNEIKANRKLLSLEFQKYELPNLMKEQERDEEKIKEAIKKIEQHKKENKPIPVPEGEKSPRKRLVLSETISRDSHVKSYVLSEADDICECCDQKAPFNRERDGRPYLEIHHLKMLADRGSDKIQNAVAICPNCHRELHYGENREQLLESLYKKIPRLEME